MKYNQIKSFAQQSIPKLLTAHCSLLTGKELLTEKRSFS